MGMDHQITDADAKALCSNLKQALAISNEVFAKPDPDLVFAIYDRLVARAHCCRLHIGEDMGDEDDDAAPWR